MISGALAGILIGITVLEIFAQTFVRTYYENNKKVYWFFLAWFFYGLLIYLLYKAYDYTNFAIANAIWSALSIIGITLVGVFYFKESISTMEIIGIVLIIIGTFIIGAYETEKV